MLFCVASSILQHRLSFRKMYHDLLTGRNSQSLAVTEAGRFDSRALSQLSSTSPGTWCWAHAVDCGHGKNFL